MDPLQVSARFIAWVWFSNRQHGQAVPAEAERFVSRNWEAFLPLAHRGLGRLLIELAGPRRRRRSHPPIPGELAVALLRRSIHGRNPSQTQSGE
jgi:hypothetical protein